ncbi:MAG: DUF5721 family protein [Bilifractor sp.]|jgi:hypothetical protein
MIALQIEHVGSFMNQLLLKETFDRFLVSEAQITTFTTFSIDGQSHPEFYEDDASEDTGSMHTGRDAQTHRESLVRWKDIRSFCVQIFKGRRLPLSFRFVFQLSSGQIRWFMEKNELNYDPEDVLGLFLNIQYRNHTLTVTTGSSLRTFTMDRTIDQAWDRYVQKFFTACGLD